MKTSNENEKLESLLAQGAITEDEYNTLIKKNLNISSGQEKKADITSESTQNAKEDFKIISNLSRFPQNVVHAGSHIQRAVVNKIACAISNALAIIVFFYILFDSLPKIVQGRVDFLEIAIIPLILMFIGFIFWVFYLKNLNKSGLYLQTSEAINWGRGIIKITPSRKRQEYKGLMVGQEFEGGIIGFFDKTGTYVGIVAKSDLPDKMNYDQAKIACEKYSDYGHKDWFLPDHNEMEGICMNLHVKNIGDFKNDLYLGTKNYVVDFSKKTIVWLGNFKSKEDLYCIRPLRIVKIVW